MQNFGCDGLDFPHTTCSSLLGFNKQRWGKRLCILINFQYFFCHIEEISLVFCSQKEMSSFQSAAASLSDSLKVRKLKKEK